MLSVTIPTQKDIPGFTILTHRSNAYLVEGEGAMARVLFQARSSRLDLIIRIHELPTPEKARILFKARSSGSAGDMPKGLFSARSLGDEVRHSDPLKSMPDDTAIVFLSGRREVDLSLMTLDSNERITDKDRAMLEKLALSICERLKPLHHAEKASPSEYLRPRKPNKKP